MHHSFSLEPEFYNISIYLLKGCWLDVTAKQSLILSNTLLVKLWHALVCLSGTHFQYLCLPDRDYTTHTTIPEERVNMFTAYALYYNLDIPTAIRFLGGNYTASYTNVDHIIRILQK